MFWNSSLFFYKIIFFFELLMSEIMFTYTIQRKRHFWLKFSGCLVVILLITIFYPLPVFNWWYTSLMFALIWSLTVGAMFILFDEKPANILFLAVASYLVQHVAYQANNTILNFAGLSKAASGVYGQELMTSEEFTIAAIMIELSVYVTIYLLCFVIFAKQIKKSNSLYISSTYLVVFIGFVLILIIGINAYVVYEYHDTMSGIFMGFFNLVATICCFLALGFLFKLVDQKHMEKELNNAYEIIRQERRQYELSMNNVEMINRRVHDLKHQMEAIVSNENIRSEVAKEITSSIQIYDSSIKTGNTVLDTILTEKSLECNQKNIKITCLVDGKKLDFISELDLYTFFGNALDNAIESVSALPEEKRAISLTLNEKGNYYSLVIQNYTENKIEPIADDKGRVSIKSSKKENFHGYGIRSMETIVEKYGGNLTFEVKDGIFYLYVLFIRQ